MIGKSAAMLPIAIVLVLCSAVCEAKVQPPNPAFATATLPLLEAEPEALSESERLAASDALFDAGFPATAAWALGPSLDTGQTAELLFRRLRLAQSMGDLPQILRLTEQLAKAVDLPTSWDKDPWDARLAEIARALRGYNLFDLGGEWIDAWRASHPDWPALAAEAAVWQQRFGAKGARVDIEAHVESCPAFDACLAWADAAKALDRPVLTGLALIRAWRQAENGEAVQSAFERALAYGLKGLALRLLPDALAEQPEPARLEKWIAALPDGKETFVGYLNLLAPANDAERWESLRLLWKAGQPTTPIEALRKPGGGSEDPAAMLAELRLLATVIGETSSGGQRNEWIERAAEIWKTIPREKLEPLDRLSLIRSAAVLAQPATRGELTSLLQSTLASGATFSQLAEIDLLLAMGDFPSAVTKVELLNQQATPEAKSVLWEWTGHWQERALFHTDRRAFSLVIESMKELDTASAPLAMLAQAVRFLQKTNKPNEALSLIRRTTQEPQTWPRQFLLAGLALESRGNREAIAHLDAVTDEMPASARLWRIDLNFRLSRHERALEEQYALRSAMPSSESLTLALRMAAFFHRYKTDLRTPRKNEQASPDLYLHSLLSSIFLHIDDRQAAADWETAFALLGRLRGDPRTGDYLASLRLRELLWRMENDLDNAVFDAFQRFDAFGPQPVERLFAAARALAGNANSDYFESALSALSAVEAPAGEWRKLLWAASESSRQNIAARLEKIESAWKAALEANDKGAAFERQGELALSLAAWRVQEAELATRALASTRTQTDKLSATLTQLRNRFRANPDTGAPPLRRLSIAIVPDPQTHSFSSKIIAAQLAELDWLIGDCLEADASANEAFRFPIETTTDENGLVQMAAVFELPKTQDSARECLRSRLTGCPLEGVEPPFGHGRVIVEATPGEPRGWTMEEQNRAEATLMKLIERLAETHDRTTGEIEEIGRRTAALANADERWMNLAYRASYEPEVYRDVAWWQTHVKRDLQTAARIRREARWISLMKPAGVLLGVIAILLVMGWLRGLGRKLEKIE
ncbi:MAG: hypothetical protein C4523_00470 [Myxococcales bacterium]|nr:MAG: hypothetical protein C4523_00470 [Myxococcales bacterium]